MKFLSVVLLATALSPAACAQEAYSRPPLTSAADSQAIVQVTLDFRSALARQDIQGLSNLLISENILFTSPPSPAYVRLKRERGAPAFTGVEPGGFAAFAAFVAGSKVPLEEKFYNVKISQDGHLAWVSFDFEFLADGKVENYGVESWQLLKASDDRWKIMTVVWSSHGAPKQ